MEVSCKLQPKIGKSMSIRARTLVFQLIVVLAIVMLAVTAFWSLQSANDTRDRVRMANHSSKR